MIWTFELAMLTWEFNTSSLVEGYRLSGSMTEIDLEASFIKSQRNSIE